MLYQRLFGLLLGVVLWAPSAQAQRPPNVEMTYHDALAAARRQAPALVAARARAREAASLVDAASVWRFNPELSGSAGARLQDGGTTVDWSVEAQQWFELGGQSEDRVNAAQAAARAGAARSDDAQRLLLKNVSVAFVAALYWQRRLGLAEENLRIATEIERAAAKRHEVGDVGGLEHSVAELTVIRAGSGEDRVKARLAQSVGRLKGLLGLDAATELRPRGDLRNVQVPDSEGVALDDRADLRALEADIVQAQSDVDRGRAQRVPDLAIGLMYAHEESSDIVQGSASITIPVFDHGQGIAAVAEARQRRLRSELDAARKTVYGEVRTTKATVQALTRAARRFEDGGLAVLERAERLATTSYEAGAIPLGELLSVRRELVQARLDYADVLLGAATARIKLAAEIGALR